MKVEEIAEIRKELKSIFALILQQAIALDVLSKKKGLFAQAFFRSSVSWGWSKRAPHHNQTVKPQFGQRKSMTQFSRLGLKKLETIEHHFCTKVFDGRMFRSDRIFLFFASRMFR